MNTTQKVTDNQVIIMNTNRLQAANQAREAHRENIQRNIERRLQVARANGDERLVRQLEDEMKSCR
ncbi:hypothetical protein NIES2107_68700 (plasmid) [Nostoc carneum NIES-2107]|nr:hypothetical protein NIES2107_68700 [Nostoc carneum NIES-2107]